MVEVIIIGKHDTGRTTLANIVKDALESKGYTDVMVEDTDPLPENQKSDLTDRHLRNREKPVRIRVETRK